MRGAFAQAPSMAAMWLTSPALLQSQARAGRLHINEALEDHHVCFDLDRSRLPLGLIGMRAQTLDILAAACQVQLEPAFRGSEFFR
jgi:hypothetical protein